MNKRYRAFRHDFLLAIGSFLPTNDELAKSLRARGIKFWTNTPSAVRNGGFASEDVLWSIIALFIEKQRELGYQNGYAVLAEFLSRRGILRLTHDNRDAILSQLCGDPTGDPPPRSGSRRNRVRDWLLLPLDVVTGLEVNRVLSRVQRCEPEEVAVAVDWMFVCSGRAHTRNGESLLPPYARLRAAECIGIDCAGYAKAASEWHETNRWTVIFACERTKNVGMSVVLPVTEVFYEAVRGGRRASFECSSSDIVVPSRHLIIEAAAERYGLDPHENPTSAINGAIIAQICALTRHGQWPGQSVYHWLSFEGTDTNTKRLAARGFRYIAKRSAKSGYPLWEQVVDLQTGLGGISPVQAGLLYIGGIACPLVPPRD